MPLPSFPDGGEPFALACPSISPMRPATDADFGFLRALYGSSREEELTAAPWTDDQKEQFLDLQFGFQHRSYLAAFPDAHFLVVEQDGCSIGRLYLDTTRARWHIIDLAIAPPWRGQGKGTAILRDLQRRAAEDCRSIGLHVDRHNAGARKLYLRLSFTEAEEGPTHNLLVWP